MSIAPPNLTAAALAPGRKLDRYELVCPIAEGGMGLCWLARLTGKHGFEKLVAIKTMKSEYTKDPEFERMFLDEARIASRIEHAHVAQILELGEDDDVLYMVMEYVDGDSLFKLRREVAQKNLSIPCGIAVRIMADTLGGLHAAHQLADAEGVSLGVVHRDVSPQNILVNVRGSAKLIDFGIAKARDRTAGDTSTGTIKGKLHFMAPEQALGKPIDGRTDVFSVGAILYFLLGGDYAYHGDTQAATILKLAEGKPPLPLPRSVPPAISTVVMKSLSFDPSRRYQSAAEMQAALEEALRKSGQTTTQADVAAYVSEHLGHRAEARKRAIERAIAALAAGPVADAPPLTTNSDKFPAMDAAAMAAAQAAALGETTPLQTDPGTTGASSMMLTPAPPIAGMRKVPLIALAAGGAVGLVVVVILVVVALRSKTPDTTNTVGAEQGSSAAVVESPPATTTIAAASASANVESNAGSETNDATAAATDKPATTAATTATTATTATKPRPTWTARPPTPPTGTGTVKHKRRVDDGF